MTPSHIHTHAHTHTRTHTLSLHIASLTHDSPPQQWIFARMREVVLQCVAVCCSVLQCVAVCCGVLQCVAVCCSVLQLKWISARMREVCEGRYVEGSQHPFPLQHTATYCNTLQHTATQGRYVEGSQDPFQMQHTATYCNTLQHTATQGRYMEGSQDPLIFAPMRAVIVLVEGSQKRWTSLTQESKATDFPHTGAKSDGLPSHRSQKRWTSLTRVVSWHVWGK